MASLEAVRADLAALRAQVNTLEEVEGLLVSLYEASRAPVEPAVSKRSNPAPNQQIAEAFGARRKAVARMLKSLIDAGEIAADGPMQSRRFRSSAAKPVPEPGMYPLYDALSGLGGTATTKQLAEAAGTTVADVVDRGRDLERFGYVGRISVGRGHRWVVADGLVGP